MKKSTKIAGAFPAIGIAAGSTLAIFAFAVFPLAPRASTVNPVTARGLRHVHPVPRVQ
ncbi:MAG: hypothetical protein Q6373_011370 [Candidatus Sigynarchaeota archaeon]